MDVVPVEYLLLFTPAGAGSQCLGTRKDRNVPRTQSHSHLCPHSALLFHRLCTGYGFSIHVNAAIQHETMLCHERN